MTPPCICGHARSMHDVEIDTPRAGGFGRYVGCLKPGCDCAEYRRDEWADPEEWER